MDTRQDTATRTQTGNRGRYLRGLDLANRRRGYSYVERAAHVGGDTYMVPSCTTEGVRYRVELGAGYCYCEDHRRGNTCKHIFCAEILASRRRATLEVA
jgi:hypothetical protein